MCGIVRFGASKWCKHTNKTENEKEEEKTNWSENECKHIFQPSKLPKTGERINERADTKQKQKIATALSATATTL